jgi:hypothetical protein
MKLTKRIAVIYTLVQGRKQYVAHTSPSSLLAGLKVTRFTPLVDQAKEFDNEVEAEDCITKLVNPAGRVFSVCTETIDVEKQQEQKSWEEALT